ncbi:MAG: hypothetical protein ACFBRM_08860 [Pikeienuella sp.]
MLVRNCRGVQLVASVLITLPLRIIADRRSTELLAGLAVGASVDDRRKVTFALAITARIDAQDKSFLEPPEPVTISLRGFVDLSVPGVGIVVVGGAAEDFVETPGLPDGSDDFGGASGATLLDLTATGGSSPNTIPATAISGFFTGTRDVLLTAIMTDESAITPSLQSIVRSSLDNPEIGAELTVTYNFPAVPVPAGLPLALTGLLGLAAIARRSRA